MYFRFKELPLWPTRETIDKYMPACFRNMYPTTRCIVDATQIFIDIPANPSAQQLTFSHYKNHNTLKALISDLYGGNISDKKLTQMSGLLKLLEPGNTIMADCGFIIDDILPHGVTLNVPPRMNESGQLTESKRTTTRCIESRAVAAKKKVVRPDLVGSCTYTYVK